MILQIFVMCLFSLGHATEAPAYDAPYVTTYEEKPQPPQPYSFNIDVKDEYGTTLNRQEVGDDRGNKKGTYGYTDAYGISRQVDYVADDKGFRAVVKTNEPGTDNQNPADVEIISNAVQVPPSYESPSIPSYPQSVQNYERSTAVISDGPAINAQPIRQSYPAPVALGAPPNGYNPIPSQPVAPINGAALY